MKIAVTAATGQLGRLVIEDLKTKTDPSDIVAIVRDPAKAADLGVEVRGAGYDDPAALETALAGVDVLLLISGNEMGKRLAQHGNVIAAAKASGVGRVVYTSVLRADATTLVLGPEHLGTEDQLKASGLAWTILRNGWYTENYTASVAGAVAGGAFVGSAGDGRISSAARRDFAEAAVAALTGEGHEGKTYELAGDDSYTLADLAAEISRQTGKQVPYKNLPEAEYAAVLAGFGLPEQLAAAYASFDTSAAAGDLFHDGRDLATLIGRPTTPMAQTVAEALKDGRS